MDPINLHNYVQKFEGFTVGYANSSVLNVALKKDANALLRKGIESLLQGLSGLDAGHKTWALIKLYYATYFFLRAELAFDDVAILRCRSIYTLAVALAQKPQKMSGKKAKGDHQATIALFSRHFAGRDVLLSQQIDTQNPYEWLRDQRDWVNYRRRDFLDDVPQDGIFSNSMSFSDQVTLYCDDQIPIYCFDHDYAALALPVKRAELSIKIATDRRTIFEACLAMHLSRTGHKASCKALEKCLT